MLAQKLTVRACQRQMVAHGGRLGADTDSIFHDLGYTDTEIAAMKASGAIQ